AGEVERARPPRTGARALEKPPGPDALDDGPEDLVEVGPARIPAVPGEPDPRAAVRADHVVVLRLVHRHGAAVGQQRLRGEPVDGQLERPASVELVGRL